MPVRGSGHPYRNGSRYWGNFERFADVGGKREPLVAPGDKLATDDEEIALTLYTQRVAYYRELKRDRVLIGRGPDISPAAFATKHYLPHQEQVRRVKRRLRADQPLPKKDVAALKKTRHAILTCLQQPALKDITGMGQIDTSHISALVNDLLTTAGTTTGKSRSPDTVRRLVMELSGMLTRAKFMRIVRENPIVGHPDVPPPSRGSALNPDGFLTRTEVKALLENVVYSPKNPWAVEQAYVLFYTGCRLEELNGLLVRDFDFDGMNVNFIENEARDFKTLAGRRRTPFWPKLQEVMRQSFARYPRPADSLAFPRRGALPGMRLDDQKMTRLRGSLKSAARRGTIEKKIGHHIARHSYCSARMETFHTDALGRHLPIEYSVIAREVGHATAAMIETTYGHLPRMRVRQDVLDYGDEAPDLAERHERARRLASDGVKAGIKAAKERARRDRRRSKKRDRPARGAGRSRDRRKVA